MPSLVQCSDTGVYTGNTTAIGSGTSAQILGANTGIGHCVVLMIQSLVATTDSVTAVTSGMGTFTRVNSYTYTDADDEMWVCLSTTGAADSITVTCPSSDAWQAGAFEFDTAAIGAVDGGENSQSDTTVSETITVSPLAVGNLVIVFQDSVNNFTDILGSPWSIFATGTYFNTFTNGTSAAWLFASSTSSVTATWPGGQTPAHGPGGGAALTQAALIEFPSVPSNLTITAERLPF
jgi:hypothetical protein